MCRLRTDCDDYINGAIAKKLIDLAKAGERNPDLLCERVLNDISHAYVGRASAQGKPRRVRTMAAGSGGSRPASTRRPRSSPSHPKKEIAALKADKTIPEAQKKQDLAELEAALRIAKPIQFKGNIALVLKYFDKLSPLMMQEPGRG